MSASMSIGLKHNLLCIVLVFIFFNCTFGIEVELTIYIDPGREECFYQSLKTEQELEIDYQVGLSCIFTLHQYLYLAVTVVVVEFRFFFM